MNERQTEQLFARAIELVNSQRYLDALGILDEIAAAHPTSQKYVYAKAKSLAYMGRVEEAHETIQTLRGVFEDNELEALAAQLPDPLLSTSRDFNDADSELVPTSEVDINAPSKHDLDEPSKPSREAAPSADLVPTDEAHLDAPTEPPAKPAASERDGGRKLSVPEDIIEEESLGLVVGPDDEGDSELADPTASEVSKAVNTFDLDTGISERNTHEPADLPPPTREERTPSEAELAMSFEDDTVEVAPAKPETDDTPVEMAPAADDAEPDFEEPTFEATEDQKTLTPFRDPLFNLPQGPGVTPEGEDALELADGGGATAMPGATAGAARRSGSARGKTQASRVPEIHLAKAWNRRTLRKRAGIALFLLTVLGAAGYMGMRSYINLGGAWGSDPYDTAEAPPVGPRTVNQAVLLEQLTDAIDRVEPERVRELIGQGVDMESTVRNGHTPLTFAIEKSVPPRGAPDSGLTDTRFVSIVRQLIEAGADVNGRDAVGKSALHYAVNRGATDLIGILIDNGARVDVNAFSAAAEACRVDLAAPMLAADIDLSNPAFLISAVRARCPAVINSLLERGADINAADAAGRAPLVAALFDGPSVRFGTTTNQDIPVTVNEKSLALAALLIDKGADIAPALVLAVETGNREYVEFFEEHGADIAGNDKLLFAAIRSGQTSMINYLVEAGADLNATDAAGRTPMAYAQLAQEEIGIDPKILLLLKRLSSVEQVQTVATRPKLQPGEVGFPETRSVGVIYAQNSSGAWQKIADARGAFKPPKGDALKLELTPTREDDLEALVNLLDADIRVVRAVGPAITDASMEYIGQLRATETLELIDTAVTDRAFRRLDSLTQLRRLAVAFPNKTGPGSITGDGLLHLRHLPNLHELDLTGTDLTSRSLGFCAELPALRRLNVSGTRVGEAGIATLATMRNLEAIIMGDSSATALGISAWGLMPLERLSNLRELTVYGLSFTDESADLLGKFLGLRALRIAGSNLTDDRLEALESLENLRELDVRGTNVTEEGVAEFKKAMPDCRVIS